MIEPRRLPGGLRASGGMSEGMSSREDDVGTEATLTVF